MNYTVEQAEKWAADNRKDLDESRLSSTSMEVQMFNKANPELSRLLWDSGCWVQEVLAEHHVPDEKIHEVQFVCGQRAFGGNAWAVSVAYVNEFLEHGDIKDRPGNELAEEINQEMFGEN